MDAIALTVLAQQVLLGLLLGGLYGLAAAGLSLVFGVLKVLDVAHGELIMLGGYGTFWLFALLRIDPFASLLLVIPGALVLGAVLYAALFGFVSSFGNLEMSLFIVGPGRTTLPIAIIQYLEWKIDPTIAAVSVVQILLIGGAMLLTDRYVKLARVV